MISSRFSRLWLIAVLIIIGSSNPVAIKYALIAGWPPFLLGVFRSIFIAVFFITWSALLRENPLGQNRISRQFSIIASICKGVSVILFYLALSKIPVSRLIIISTISPVINLVLVHWLLEHEEVTRTRVAGVLVSLAGILLMLIYRSESTDTTRLFSESINGDISIITSIILLQFMMVFEKKALNSGANPRQLTATTNIFSLAAFTLCFFLSAESLVKVPLDTRGISSYLYLITVAGIFLFYYRRWLASKLEVSFISSFSYLGKATSILYATLLLREPVSTIDILAFGIILTGSLIATRETDIARLFKLRARSC